jgi:O-antigen ligase
MLDWLPPIDVCFLLGVLAALAVASLFWVADTDLRPDSIRALRRVILEPMLVVPGLTRLMRYGQYRRVERAIAIPAIGIAILAMGQFVTGHSTVDIGGIARPIGTFTHPNNLSFYLERPVWFVPIAVTPLVAGRPRLANVPTALVLGALLATLSRGAVLALVGGGLVYFWPLPLRYWKKATAGVVALGAVAFGARYLADSDSSIGSREYIWRAAIQMVRDHPITGVGLDQFLGEYGRRYVLRAGWPERYTSHPHNIVLDFWLSLGIGGVLVLWLLAEAVWRRVVTSISEPRISLQRAAAAMLVAGLAHGLFDNGFFLPDLATWTWIGLVIATQSAVKRPVGASNG